MAFELPELEFDYKALEPYIDEATMHLHHDKHHATYIEKLNAALEGLPELQSMDITELLQNLDKVPEDKRTAVRNNGGGHANHTLFWSLMAGHATEPAGELSEAINSTFGNLEDFKAKFSEIAVAQFGSGWGWLIADGGKLEITSTPNQDTPVMEGKTPILGVDVWEHAYYLKWQNRRADYITAWWNVVNWKRVEELFSTAK